MAHGHFLWTDLSTYDPTAAREDYARMFGWTFSGDETYDFAARGRDLVAAIFPMPERLAQIDMPSFWMSYVHVEDVAASVAKARAHEGVIIEVEPQEFGEGSRVALVRDPSGAGFTLYEGPEIAPAPAGPGRVEARFHHLGDVARIEGFYGDLFGWRFERVTDDPWPVFDILHPDGSRVAQVEEVPQEVRGKFCYWMPSFGVADVADAVAQLAALSGTQFTELTDGRALVADRQGAHFMVQPAAAADDESTVLPPPAAGPFSGFAWKAGLGLICVWLAVVLDIQAFWGVLFLIWTWPALRSGRADFIETVERRTQPLMYWALIGTWIFLSLWLIAAPFLLAG
ncbi:MAG: VOC family protein [Pseudomonadota bacterium]